MRVTPLQIGPSWNSVQIEGHNADWFVVARALKELQKRPTRYSFDELRREKLSAESLFLSSAFIVEVEEDRVEHVGVDTSHIPRHVDVAWFTLRRDEAAAHEHPSAAGVAQQAQRLSQFRQLVPPMRRRAKTLDKRWPRRG